MGYQCPLVLLTEGHWFIPLVTLPFRVHAVLYKRCTMTRYFLAFHKALVTLHIPVPSDQSAASFSCKFLGLQHGYCSISAVTILQALRWPLDNLMVHRRATLRSLRDCPISYSYLNVIWRSLQDTVGPGCYMSTRVDHTCIMWQNRAPKSAAAKFENPAICEKQNDLTVTPCNVTTPEVWSLPNFEGS